MNILYGGTNTKYFPAVQGHYATSVSGLFRNIRTKWKFIMILQNTGWEKGDVEQKIILFWEW